LQLLTNCLRKPPQKNNKKADSITESAFSILPFKKAGFDTMLIEAVGESSSKMYTHLLRRCLFKDAYSMSSGRSGSKENPTGTWRQGSSLTPPAVR
jgi:hypothetical protein